MAKRKRQSRTPLIPLTENELKKTVRPRPAASGAADQIINFSLAVPASQPPDVRITQPVHAGAQVIRYQGQAAAKGGQTKAFGIEIAVRSVDLGSRVFRPSVKGTRLNLPPETKATLQAARLGLPSLDGFRPRHLPLRPIPPPVERVLRVRKYFEALPGRAARKGYQATTLHHLRAQRFSVMRSGQEQARDGLWTVP